MSTTNIHLLQFKSLTKTETLNAGTSELIPKVEKKSKISNVTFAILHIKHQNTSNKLPSDLLFLKKPSDMLQDG